MKKFAWLMPLTLCLFSAGATAHGPVRQKVERDIEINAPTAKVWNIIKNYDDMSWLPSVKSVTANGGNTVGATRVLTLKHGGTINEEMKKYDEAKMSYAYRISDMSIAKTISHLGKNENIPVLPVTDYSASLSVEPKGDHSLVKWKAGFYRAYMNNLTKDGEPKEMNEEVAIAAVEEIFKAGLENIKALAEK
jgi:carbon monoxide dehydrogenase subunit G